MQLYKAVCKAAYNYKNSNGVVAPTTYTVTDPLPLKVGFAKAAGLPYEGPFVSTNSLRSRRSSRATELHTACVVHLQGRCTGPLLPFCRGRLPACQHDLQLVLFRCGIRTVLCS